MTGIGLADIAVVVILLLTIGAAAAYIVKAKKSGVKCIGCPASGNCASKGSCSSSGCSCNCTGENKASCHADTKE